MTETSKTEAETAETLDTKTEEAAKNGNGARPKRRRARAATTNGSTTEAAESAETAAHRLAQMRHDPAAIRRAFETGEYPYKQKMRRTVYEKHKAELQVELLKVQEWVKATGQKIVILFEGRDAAGKGGTIKRFMPSISIRAARA